MKRKMIVVSLVIVSLGVLVVEGVSQPAAQPTQPLDLTPPSPAPSPPFAPPAVPTPYSNPQPQELTFEQLVEALKGVRARQKELQAQESDLLAKMAKKVEEKRNDLSRSETTLQQLRGENGRFLPEKHIRDTKLGDKTKG